MASAPSGGRDPAECFVYGPSSGTQGDMQEYYRLDPDFNWFQYLEVTPHKAGSFQ